MYLYCERSLYNKDSQAYEVIFDFHSVSDLKRLEEFYNLEKMNNFKSLLFLESLKVERYKGPRSGFWYNIPIDFFEEFIIVNEALESNVIRMNLKMKNAKGKLNFQQYREKMKESSI